eukprot:12453200-Alexandrium_andersonii.AAC.1
MFAGVRVALGGWVSRSVCAGGGGELGLRVISGVASLLSLWGPMAVAGAWGGWRCRFPPKPLARWPRTCWSSQR